MNAYSLRHLTDDAVTRELGLATSADRRTTAAHLAHIAEFDHRRLYLPGGCSSMFRYCVGRLSMSEDVAVQRIRAARIAREHPHVFDAVANGRLNVTALHLLSKHLTKENAAPLLAAAEGRSIRQVTRMIAEWFGRAPALDTTEAFSTNPETSTRIDTGGNETTCELAAADAGPATRSDAGGDPLGIAPGPPRVASLPCAAAGLEWRATLKPVAAGRFELVAQLGQEAHDQLVASRDLLGHAVPSGDLLEVIERAIALQFAQLRRRRCGAADRPRANAAEPDVANPRRVRRAVVRAVWERDGGQCTFVGAGGHRCTCRDRLELDHIIPVARGGKSTVENLRLLCSAHNRHVAECEFGRETVRARIEAARNRRAGERLRRQAERERAEARKAAMARQDEELGVALRNLGYRGESLCRALVHCAERADAPPEARLRHALSCMAPNARRVGALA